MDPLEIVSAILGFLVMGVAAVFSVWVGVHVLLLVVRVVQAIGINVLGRLRKRSQLRRPPPHNPQILDRSWGRSQDLFGQVEVLSNNQFGGGGVVALEGLCPITGQRCNESDCYPQDLPVMRCRDAVER